ncbi:MAG: helix-turn-helix transcriptional regulator [Anaerolineae bacterium]|nr:helix-turn-helix transcriptional regulator [Anaerolineae bacterium]
MTKYGQYCPVAQALELLGDRWTLLIIRDLLTGTHYFNDLERGLPGISRGLLAKRLRQLQDAGLVEKCLNESGRNTTEYHLTQAGQEIQEVINALLMWGTRWAFGEPSPEQLDPLLLMWWMRNRVHVDRLPEERVVVQFDFYGAKTETYWLLMSQSDVAICLTDPGYEINVLVTADLAAFFKLWLGNLEFDEVIHSQVVRVEAIPRLVRAFPDWFAWSPAATAVRAARVAEF